MAGKTPVSILHEFCQKRGGMKCSFDVASMRGTPNDPIFEVSATVLSTGTSSSSQTYVGIGTGRSKQDAKQEAARAVLRKLQEDPAHRAFVRLPPASPLIPPVPFTPAPCPAPFVPNLDTFTTPDSPRSPASIAGTISSVGSPGTNVVTDIGTTENAVGRLQEFCAQNALPLPVYVLMGQHGQSHQPIFTMKVSLGEESAEGRSRTKQAAKQEAAKLLYDILVKKRGSLGCIQIAAMPLVPGESPVQPKPIPRMTEAEVDFVIEKYEECKPLTTIPKTNPSLKFNAYHTSLQNLLSSVKEDLNKAKFFEPKEALRDVARKLQLNISYHEARDIFEKETDPKRVYVYAIVNSQPTTVQIGEGDTVQKAEGHAALTVLRYWQTFLGIFPLI